MKFETDDQKRDDLNCLALFKYFSIVPRVLLLSSSLPLSRKKGAARYLDLTGVKNHRKKGNIIPAVREEGLYEEKTTQKIVYWRQKSTKSGKSATVRQLIANFCYFEKHTMG